MSYILEALKKAEQERGLAKVPTLTTIHQPRLWILNRRRGWVVAGAAGLGAAAALVWALLPPGPEGLRRAPVHPEQAPAPPTEGTSATAVPPTPAAAPPIVSAPPATRPRQEAATAPSGAPPLPRTLFPPTSKPRPTGSAAVAPEAAPAEPAQGAQAVPAPEPFRQRTPAAPGPAASPTPPPAAAPAVPTPQAVPVSPAPAPMPAPATPTPAAPAAAPAHAPSLHEALASMRIDMLVYTDAEADRMVTINGRKYVKGDAVEGRYKVDEITREGVTLSYGGETAVLRP